MKAIRRIVTALAAIWIVAGPSAAQTPPPHKVCLWRIAGRKNTVFLLGSIHMLPAHATPLDPRIQAAFTQSREVVFEIDFSSAMADAAALRNRGVLPHGITLDSLLSPPLRHRLHAAIDTLHLQPDAIDRMKPWLAALTLSSTALRRAGYTREHGIDIELYRRAVAADKRITALETAREQIDILDRLDQRDQIGVLKETLNELGSLPSQAEEVAALWRSGNSSALFSILRGTFRETPILYERIVIARNRRWLPRILRLTRRTHDVLVVVGALHLVGPDGLVELCREHGFTTVQE